MSNDHNEITLDLQEGQTHYLWHLIVAEQKLAVYDIESSIAHIKMLSEVGTVKAKDAQSVIDGLKQIKEELVSGKYCLKPVQPNIHAAIEERLQDLVGDHASILNMAKSSNDQIATDIRLWQRDECVDIFSLLIELRQVFINLAGRDLKIIMPGYTHMQPATPILLSHFWLACEAYFKNDMGRLSDFFARLNVLPLGAYVLAGTHLPIDRKLVAEYLKFDDVIENSVHAIFDRDFIVEFASFATIVGLHVSQIASELMLWSTQEFGFVRLRKTYVSRSLSMPQKHNPIALEVLRSQPSSIFGKLTEFISCLKGLPIGYSQDLQEVLPGLFDLASNLKFILELLIAVLPSLDIMADRMKEMASADLTNASNVVDFLSERGIPAEKASKTVEQLVNYCKQRNKGLMDLALNEWLQFSPVFDQEIYTYIEVDRLVDSLSSYGGTSLEQVENALGRAKNLLSHDEAHMPQFVCEKLKERDLSKIQS